MLQLTSFFTTASSRRSRSQAACQHPRRHDCGTGPILAAPSFPHPYSLFLLLVAEGAQLWLLRWWFSDCCCVRGVAGAVEEAGCVAAEEDVWRWLVFPQRNGRSVVLWVGELAQVVERSLSMREVVGSIPTFSTLDFVFPSLG